MPRWPDAIIEFGAEVNVDNTPSAPTRFRLDPGAFFVADAHLDFTVVLVAAGDDGRTPGTVVGGWNRLILQQGKIVGGESMNIIGHPMGRLKEISIRDNRLDLQLDEFLHYSTDTEPGNSGSPVFNDQWEVVALHHSGVPRTDSQGRTLRRDGNLWRPGDGDDAVDWVANEGVRVSVILKHLAGLDIDAGRRAILAELGPSSGIAATPAVSDAVLPPRPVERPVVVESLTRGVKARPTAFGGTRHLLFLHGRGQEGRNPDELRRIWTAGLNQGLTLAGMGTIDPADVYFPFYGDVLLQASGARESIGADTEGGELYEQLVAEAAAHLGMPAELEGTDLAADEGLRSFGSGLLGKMHAQLNWIAARSGLDAVIIARIFKDVASYLDNDQTRRRVLDTVMDAAPNSGRLVLVSHSLGTVVALDLLSRLPAELEVELFVTAGSPPRPQHAVYNKLPGSRRAPSRSHRALAEHLVRGRPDRASASPAAQRLDRAVAGDTRRQPEGTRARHRRVPRTRCGRREHPRTARQTLSFRAALYVEVPFAEMTEAGFLNRLGEETGCGVLLDLREALSSRTWVGAAARPSRPGFDLVRSIRVAGGEMMGDWYTDAHSGACPPRVWELLSLVVPEAPALRLVTFELHGFRYQNLPAVGAADRAVAHPSGSRRGGRRCRVTRSTPRSPPW